eukprot:gnl/MRDRNA2_/MRDRNA2_28417_c0_seq1.p1 gnl/MRDRNA2_/MRDRNA2_28417_c0~~gnl/MRDRNA2_/MRDRNA2_28417_c0_seq1.p1  ORF type:complete len:702 (+),score=125.01 gnl/MRDRNA2_/MRDRNA2_28417_c0_seq1:152-2257(+)
MVSVLAVVSKESFRAARYARSPVQDLMQSFRPSMGLLQSSKLCSLSRTLAPQYDIQSGSVFAHTESACTSSDYVNSQFNSSSNSFSSSYLIQSAMLRPDADLGEHSIVHESIDFTLQSPGSMNVFHDQVSGLATQREVICSSLGMSQLDISLKGVPVLNSKLQSELPHIKDLAAEPLPMLMPQNVASKQQRASSNKQKAARMAKMAAVLRRFEACADGYSLMEALGGVSSATPTRMFLARNNATSTVHLMKRIDREELQRALNLSDAEFNQQMVLELQYHQNADHPHVLKLFESHEDEQYSYFVMEATNKGSLNSLVDATYGMHATSQSPVNEGAVANVLEHVLDALHHLHKGGRIHTDVRLENIMQSNTGDTCLFKLLDLGALSKHQADAESRHLTTLAPEVMINLDDGKVPSERFQEGSDIWSLGLVAFELLVGRLPFEVVHQAKDRKNVTRKSMTKIDYQATLKNIEAMDVRSDLIESGHSSEVVDLLGQMLSLQPECRPSASECLQNAWILRQKASRAQQPQHQKRPKRQRPDPAAQKKALRRAAAVFCASHLPLSLMSTAAERFTSIIGELVSHTVTSLDSQVQLLRKTVGLDEACARYVVSALDEFSNEGDLQEYADILHKLCQDRDQETLKIVRAAFESAGQSGLSLTEIHHALEHHRADGLSLLPITDVRAWLQQKSLLGDLPEPRMEFLVTC